MITLIKSVKIIDEYSEYHNQIKDILLEDGLIKAIADSIQTAATYEVVSQDNLHVSFGWCDTSVSFGEPGDEDNETVENGLYTASKSGFTAVCVNSNEHKVTDSKSIVEFLKYKAVKSPVDMYPIGALTQESKGVEMAELYDMQQHGAIAFGDYKQAIENDNLLKIALLYAQNFDGLVLSFPKNNKIAGAGVVHEGVNATKLGLKGIPAMAEEIQIARDLFLLEYTGGRLHIPTISTQKSVELIEAAKQKGLNVTCGVTVHHLALTDDELFGFDSNYKVNPPLRTEKDRKALVKAVKTGVIDIITSDHRPIHIEDKKVEFSIAKDGTIGLETAFKVLNTILDIETIVRCISENPRKIFGIATENIQIGKKANLTFFNPDKKSIFCEEDIVSTSKNSIFLGKELKGNVVGIYNNNQLILN